VEYELSEFTEADTEAVNQISLSAFQQYQHEYNDWEAFASRIANMAALAASGEVIVARVEGQVAGAVTYVGPGKEKAPFFEAEWPVLRMLVVGPHFRGRGIGRALTEECIKRAARDGAPVIALHTSRIMKVALSMYERMGFRFARQAPMICGVPYGVYVLRLSAGKPARL
jgi:ribosomal protein S18 acetylase RimI-like enzyme